MNLEKTMEVWRKSWNIERDTHNLPSDDDHWIGYVNSLNNYELLFFLKLWDGCFINEEGKIRRPV